MRWPCREWTPPPSPSEPSDSFPHSVDLGGGMEGERKLSSDSSMAPAIPLTLQADRGPSPSGLVTKYPPMSGRPRDGGDQWSLMECLCPAWPACPARSPALKRAQAYASSSLAELPSEAAWAGFLLRKSSQQGQPADKLKLT